MRLHLVRFPVSKLVTRPPSITSRINNAHSQLHALVMHPSLHQNSLNVVMALKAATSARYI